MNTESQEKSTVHTGVAALSDSQQEKVENICFLFHTVFLLPKPDSYRTHNATSTSNNSVR